MIRIERIFALASLALLLALAALLLTDHRLLVVTGGSMEPTVPRGALVIVKATQPAALRAGDVVTFERRGETVTHRVVGIETSAAGRVFATQGDANAVADPERVTFDGLAGLVRAQVPLVGYAIAAARSFAVLAFRPS